MKRMITFLLLACVMVLLASCGGDTIGVATEGIAAGGGGGGTTTVSGKVTLSSVVAAGKPSFKPEMMKAMIEAPSGKPGSPKFKSAMEDYFNAGV